MFNLVAISLLFAMLLGCQPKPDKQVEPAFSVLNQQVKGQGQVQVTRGYPIGFPKDHVSHPEFAIEWWYITANLKDAQGLDYGVQWTLFRFLSDGKPSAWSNEQQYMAHVGLHTESESWFEERFARGGVGNAGVTGSPFRAFLDNWQWLSESEELFPSQLSFTVQGQVSAQLNLHTDQPFVLHGEQGYSKKLAKGEQASYYYSQPHIQVEGLLKIDGQDKQVSGLAWFDHEWTSQYLDSNGTGWDWFSIHLDSGKKLMLFNVRHADYGDFWSGTLLDETGNTRHLTPTDIDAKIIKEVAIQGRNFPLVWQLTLPNHQLDILSSPIKTDQLHPGVFSYYEGAIKVSGSETGIGFMELTGY